jgi:hypothetical protein
LQHAVTAALQDLSSSSDADFVSKALALSKMAAAGGYSTAPSTSGNSGFIASGSGSRNSKLQSGNLEGADLFELAAGAGQHSVHDLSADAALASLEELAAAMNGILDDRSC